MIQELEENKTYAPQKIVTELAKFEKFYPAENYHFNYYDLNPQNAYCNVVVTPKVQKFLKKYYNYCAEDKKISKDNLN